jgi:protein-S-isoprenylcysteine O-methyltransferase Ste14
MEHIRVKPVSDTSAFFQAIAGFAVAMLVMLGVGGTVYRMLAPGGWFAHLFGRSLAGGLAAVLALLIIGLCAWLARTWISIGARNRHADLFVYGFAVAGAFYAIEIFSKGTL